MPLLASFCGPAYRERSENLDAESCINVFFHTLSSAGNAKKGALYGTPALKFLQSVSTAVCRGWFAQDGRQWTVVGDQIYEFDLVNTVATARGTIKNDGLPVSFASNGRGGEQLAIVGGGFLYILSLTTNTLTGPIALPLTNAPVLIEFMDGYFLINEADTIRVWFSALEDGTLWDALDFFARSQVSDNVVGIKRLRDKLWVFGSLTTESFYDSGDSDNPFVPYPGSIMQEGLVSPYAMWIRGEALVWLSQDNEGHGRMVQAVEYSPQRISTPSVEFALSQMRTIADAEIFVYEQEGHAFAGWIFPDAGQAWFHDAREDAWHERNAFDEDLGTLTTWRGRGFVATGNVILAGDRITGDLYTLDLNTFADACGTIVRERTAPYLSDENQWLFLDQVELGVENGVGNDDAPDPQVLLSISRDSAHTFDPPVASPIGAVGAYDAMTRWYQLGRVRSDRLVIRVRQTDPVKCVWGPGLWLRATPGSGLL